MKNRSDQLVQDVGKKIVTGELIPGEILPKVEEACELYGVSRTVVREALKGLSTLGWLGLINGQVPLYFHVRMAMVEY